MADITPMGAFIRCFEGGYTNDPDDPGGHTMQGATLATYAYYCRRRGYPRAAHVAAARAGGSNALPVGRSGD